MKIIFTTHNESHHVSLTFKIWFHFFAPAMIIALAVLYLSQFSRSVHAIEPSVLSTSDVEITNKLAVAYPQNIIDILAKKLGALEAESIRLNAFSSRVATMAKLDPEEFSFDIPPSQGGTTGEILGNNTIEGIMDSVEQLERRLIVQKNQLQAISHVVNGRILINETKPSSMPVDNGYISSHFGFRRDPFTGRRRKHKGIDFAGKKGTFIRSVASGIVQYTGNEGGYGKVVEVDHGQGVISRYAHLSAIDVKRKQLVKKGQIIAKMGNTGRSTGPHLHLEVLKNGVHQDPAIFLQKKQ